MNASHRQPLFAAALALCLMACQRAPQPAATTAPPQTAVRSGIATTPAPSAITYQVEFASRWTRANFPHRYPDTSLIHRPHFSGWIGTAHNGNYRLYAEGALPTLGLEALAEEGEHEPFIAEINAAIAVGDAVGIASSEALRDFSETRRFEITLDAAHPNAALVSMIAPSPDWFAAADVNLMENGAFVARKQVDVYLWDAGSDSGTDYFADDLDTDPKQPAAPALTPYFTRQGRPQPIGSLKFTRK
jgi:hypothetical protein